MTKKGRLSGVLLALGMSYSAACWAAAESPIFSIGAWTIEGNTLLPEAVLQAALVPYTRPDATFETLREAVKALETTYQNAGYSAVRVLLPEQEIDRQRVTLKIVEARLGRIVVEGNRHFETETVRASVPALIEGAVPNVHTVSHQLQVANDGPARQQTVIFKKGAGPTEVDAVIRVVDADPLRYALVADNTGNKSDNGYATGRFRLGLVAQHANLFDRDHVGSAQVVTSPDHVSDVAIIGLGYRIPLYGMNSSVDIVAGYSDVDSGTISTAGGSLNIAGRGITTSVRHNLYLPRQAEWLQKVYYGLEHRIYKNAAVEAQSGTDFTTDVAETPGTIGYSIGGRSGGYDIGGGFSFTYGDPYDIENDPPASYPHYRLWRYQLSFAHPLRDGWHWQVELAGQYSRDHLISGEQFGLGGADSIRGFEERAFANDSGQRGSLTVTGPELAAYLGVEGLLLRPSWFADAGKVWRRNALPGEQASVSVASTGLGLRGSFGRKLSFKADLGVVVEPGPTAKRNDTRLHAGLTYQF